MPANTLPQYIATPNLKPVAITAANTSSEGGGTIGTNIFLVITGGSNGTYVGKIRFMPTASAPTTMTSTVGRVFKSTKASGATTGGTDTFLFAEVVLGAASADSASVANNPVDVEVGQFLASGDTFLVTNHAAPAASTQWQAMALDSGDY